MLSANPWDIALPRGSGEARAPRLIPDDQETRSARWTGIADAAMQALAVRIVLASIVANPGALDGGSPWSGASLDLRRCSLLRSARRADGQIRAEVRSAAG